MDHIALLSNRERYELFSQSAAQLGMVPAVVEKDFWITWVLKQLFSQAFFRGMCVQFALEYAINQSSAKVFDFQSKKIV